MQRWNQKNGKGVFSQVGGVGCEKTVTWYSILYVYSCCFIVNSVLNKIPKNMRYTISKQPGKKINCNCQYYNPLWEWDQGEK